MSDQSIYKKLQKARVQLQRQALNKSGKNKFAGYEYFELSDFIPSVQMIFNDLGMCGMVSYNEDLAYLHIQDTDGPGCITFTSPMSTAALKGCHEVQNLGAVQSYLRRYLWVTAMEIVEHDALEATTGSVKPETKVEAKQEVKQAPVVVAPKIVGKPGDWQLVVEKKDGATQEEWLKLVDDATQFALEMATKEDDVMQVFKKNKALFDTVKQKDASFFKSLMAKFTETKNKFKEA
jgi:hypothetical protein